MVFCCSTCDKVFITNDYLQRHLRKKIPCKKTNESHIDESQTNEPHIDESQTNEPHIFRFLLRTGLKAIMKGVTSNGEIYGKMIAFAYDHKDAPHGFCGNLTPVLKDTDAAHFLTMCWLTHQLTRDFIMKTLHSNLTPDEIVAMALRSMYNNDEEHKIHSREADGMSFKGHLAISEVIKDIFMSKSQMEYFSRWLQNEAERLQNNISS